MRTVPTSFKRTYLVDSAFKPITPRQYIIAFKGVRTEPQYFNGLRRYIRRFGISGLSIQCIPLVRSYLEEGCSHPKLTLKLLETYLDEVKNRAMSIDTLAKHAVDWAVDICAVPHKGKEVLLRQLKNQVVEKLVENGYSSEQQYSYDNFGIIVNQCYQILIELLPITLKKQKKIKFIDAIRDECAVFSKEDVACLVVDRDSGSFMETDYDEVLTECRKRNIRLIVSNPMFEFWLLLHFTDGSDLDFERVVEYPGLLLSELKKYGIKNPKQVVFSQYEDRILDAIEHEKLFEEDIVGLKSHIGSNIGNLISEMIKCSVFPNEKK